MLNIISSKAMDSSDYAEMQILLGALALPLGEEETAPAEAASANHKRVVGALSSRLAWKKEAPQPWVSGYFFFIRQRNGWSGVEDAPGASGISDGCK